MHTDSDDDLLNAAFADLRAQPEQPSTALVARVLADAARLQPGVARPVVRPRPIARFWARIGATLGARLDVAGVASAAVVGVTVGLFQPATLAALAVDLGVLTTAEFTLLPEDGAFVFANLLEEDL